MISLSEYVCVVGAMIPPRVPPSATNSGAGGYVFDEEGVCYCMFAVAAWGVCGMLGWVSVTARAIFVVASG